MLTGLYTAASSMLAQETRQQVAANNLANAGVAGYRRQSVAFHAFAPLLAEQWIAGNAWGARHPAPRLITSVVATDGGPGAHRITGNPTDLALQGDGYFVVQTPAGEAYTRDGAFTLDADRRLVTATGCPVLGEHGPITLDSPRWEIDAAGQVLVEGQVIDRLRLVVFSDPASATRQGESLWYAPQTRPAADARVRQGCLEGSNVNPVAEMIAMISATRHFEATQKAIQALDATLDRAVNDIARV